jgi:hypothetical protein
MAKLSVLVQPQWDENESEWVQKLSIQFSEEEVNLNLRCHVKVHLLERDAERDKFDVSFDPPGWSYQQHAQGSSDDRILQFKRRTFRPRDGAINIARTGGSGESFKATPRNGGREWELVFRHIWAGIHVTPERHDGSGEPEEYYSMVYVYNDFPPVVAFSPETVMELQGTRQ